MNQFVCTKCGVQKSFEDFPKDKRARYGISRRCSECANANSRRYSKQNADLIRYKQLELRQLKADVREVKRSLGMLDERTDRQRLQSVYNQIGQRCNNPNSEKYPIYGGRGIRRNFVSSEEFINWSMKNGYQQGMQIDRIDNDGNYEPSNCRWVDGATNVRNRNVTKTFTAYGETKPVAEWVDDSRCMVNYVTLIQRIYKSEHWTPEEIISTDYQPNQNGSRVYGGDV